MLSYFIVGALLAVAFYFAWSYIHEMSHILAAKMTTGLVKYELKIFPHKDPIAGWRWAACKYWYIRDPSPEEKVVVSIAPRIPDVVAAVAFVFTGFLIGASPWLALVWGIFWASGVIDLITGSLGISEYSDLRRAAQNSKTSPWVFRLFGLGLSALSIAFASLWIFGG